MPCKKVLRRINAHSEKILICHIYQTLIVSYLKYLDGITRRGGICGTLAGRRKTATGIFPAQSLRWKGPDDSLLKRSSNLSKQPEQFFLPRMQSAHQRVTHLVGFRERRLGWHSWLFYDFSAQLSCPGWSDLKTRQIVKLNIENIWEGAVKKSREETVCITSAVWSFFFVRHLSKSHFVLKNGCGAPFAARALFGVTIPIFRFI